MNHRVVVVGGGIVGTLHAYFAVRAGCAVVQIDAGADPRGATSRGFGVLSLADLSAGAELQAGERGIELWRDLAAQRVIPHLREGGTITVARTPEEMQPAQRLVAGRGAARRGLSLLTASELHALNPAVKGEVAGAVWGRRDLAIDPQSLLPALWSWLSEHGDYAFVPGRRVLEVGGAGVLDHAGHRHYGDAVVLATGSHWDLFDAEEIHSTSLRRKKSIAFRTEPSSIELTTTVRSSQLPGRDPGVTIVQHASGELTIGAPVDEVEPFEMGLDEVAARRILTVAEAVLGQPLPEIVRRWSSVSTQPSDGSLCLRREVVPGVVVATGVGDRGLVFAPAVAERTINDLLR